MGIVVAVSKDYLQMALAGKALTISGIRKCLQATIFCTVERKSTIASFAKNKVIIVIIVLLNLH